MADDYIEGARISDLPLVTNVQPTDQVVVETSTFTGRAPIGALSLEVNEALFATKQELADQRALLGAAVAQGNVPIFDTVLTMDELTIPETTLVLRINGYSVAGVGSGIYVKSDAEPTHPGKFHTVGGIWWSLVAPATPENFGAMGDGITDDTAALANAEAYALATGTSLMLVGKYRTTIDPKSYQARMFGFGYFVFDSRSAPAEPIISVKNHFWAGHFATSRAAPAFNTETYRSMMLDGVTGARRGFVTGVTVFRDTDQLNGGMGGMRVQRNSGDASNASFVLVAPLSIEESRALVGGPVFISCRSRRGTSYSGAGCTMKLIGSRASEQQAIVRDDGKYQLGTVELASVSWLPGLTLEPRSIPRMAFASVPADIQQLAIVIETTFAGTVAANDVEDCVTFFDLGGSNGNNPFTFERPDNALIEQKASKRFRTTYPKGHAVGTVMLPGALAALATATTSRRGVVFSVDWSSDPMLYPPTVTSWTPIIGGDMYIGDETAGTRVLSMVTDVSETGFRIVNNGLAVVGNLYRSHFDARAPL